MSYYDMSDYAGKKIGRLTVIKRQPNTRNRWICKCECGNVVSKTPSDLKVVGSCGCLLRETRKSGDNNRIHGLCKSRIYHTYQSMVARCTKQNTKAYPHYGGRGISICPEWLGENGFVNFNGWAKTHGYSDDLTIDRIDVNGNYEPDNCRWVSQFEQAQNKTVSVYIDDGSQKITVKRFNHLHGITTHMFTYNRLKSGMTAEQILHEWDIMHNDNYMTQVQAAEYYDVNRTTIQSWCKNNKIEYIKIGTRVYIPKGQAIMFPKHSKRNKLQ